MKYNFKPEIETLGTFSPNASIGELAEETGMYSASPDFAKKHGGKLTQMMLNQVPESFYEECDRLAL